MRVFTYLLGLLVLLGLVAACSSPGEGDGKATVPAGVGTPEAPESRPLPTAGPQSRTPTPTPSAAEREQGRILFQSQASGCAVCHSASAEGPKLAPAPKLAATGLSFEGFLYRIRSHVEPPGPVARTVLSNQNARLVYAWLTSLGQQPATPSDAVSVVADEVAEVEALTKLGTLSGADLTEVQGLLSRALDLAKHAEQEARVAAGVVVNPAVQALLTEVANGLAMGRVAGSEAIASTTPEELQSKGLQMAQQVARGAATWSREALSRAGLANGVAFEVVDLTDRPVEGAWVAVSSGRYPLVAITNAQGKAQLSNVPAFRALDLFAYRPGHRCTRLHMSTQSPSPRAIIVLMPMPSDSALLPRVVQASLSPSTGRGDLEIGLSAEVKTLSASVERVLAVSPQLGLAVPLWPQGPNSYAASYSLPNLAVGGYDWYFLVADQNCLVSQPAKQSYEVQ